jgi:hypothetical protein
MRVIGGVIVATGASAVAARLRRRQRRLLFEEAAAVVWLWEAAEDCNFLAASGVVKETVGLRADQYTMFIQG